MPSRRETRSAHGLGERLKRLRDQELGLGQIAFAQRLRVNQAALVRWEKNQRPIPVSVLLKIAEVASPEEKRFWLSKAGVDIPTRKGASSVRGDLGLISLVTNRAGAGRGFLHDSEEIEGKLRLPRDFVGPKVACVRVSGTSMEPLIPNGSIVGVDAQQVDPRRLVGRVVAAQNDVEGLVVKRLLEHNAGLYLVSENPLFSPILFDPAAWRIAGRAVWWIVKAK